MKPTVRRMAMGVLALCLSIVAYAASVTTFGPPRVTAVATGDWQLPAGNYQCSGQVLAVEFPPANSSTADTTPTAASAYHRRAATGYDKTIPVVPSWGCPPYHFTWSASPATLSGSINDTDGDAGEGDLTLTSLVAGSWTISVRVQDQNGGDITRSWTLEVIDRDNLTYFVHLSDVVGGSETGSSSNPKHNVGQILGPDEDATTWAGRQVIVRGTHTLAGHSAEYDTNGSKLLLNSNKPIVWIADPVNGATLRGSSDNVNGAHFSCGNGSAYFWAGFTWNNPHVNQTPDGTQERNAFIDCASSSLKNGGLYGNTFNLSTTAPDPNSNSAVLFMGQSVYSGPVILAKNRYLNGQYLGPVTAYDINRLAIVRNELTNSVSGTDGFFVKGGDNDEYIWIAYNYGTGNSGGFSKIECIDFDDPLPAPWARGPVGYFHNRFVTSGLGIWLQPATGCVYTVVSKRNNWKVANHYFNNSNQLTGTSTGIWDYDSIEHSGTYTEGVRDAGAGATITRGPNNRHGTSNIVNDSTAAQEGTTTCTKGAETCSGS